MAETEENSALSPPTPLQGILGILWLGSDGEESDGKEEEGEGFSSVVTLSAFLFLLRRKFPLSNIFSQFGSRVQ